MVAVAAQKGFDEAKHPRGQPGNPGQFGPGGGGGSSEKPKEPQQEKPETGAGKPKPSAQVSESKKKVGRVFARGLKTAGDYLTPEQHKTYSGHGNFVLNSMPEAAADRLAETLKKVVFHANIEHLGESAGVYSPLAKAMVAKGKIIGGMFHPGLGAVFLDGDGPQELGNTMRARWLYGHELTHAIDYPDHTFSDTKEWQAAFKAESGKISDYAKVSPSEAFAEFGGLVYGLRAKHEELQREYPQSYAAWKKFGLLKEEAKKPQPLAQKPGPIFSQAITEKDGVHADVLKKPIPSKAKKLLGGLAKIGKDAISKAGHLEHAAKDAIVNQVSRLPAPVRLPVVGVFKAAFASYAVAQSAVAAVAKERGLDQSHVDKISKVCAAADLIGGGKILPGVLTAAGLGGLAAAGSFVPVGSLAYLAYSTARDPLATLRVARGGVRAAMKKLKLSKGEISQDGKALIEELAQRAADLGEEFDTWQAGFLVALARPEIAGDTAKALQVADEIFTGGAEKRLTSLERKIATIQRQAR